MFDILLLCSKLLSTDTSGTIKEISVVRGKLKCGKVSSKDTAKTIYLTVLQFSFVRNVKSGIEEDTLNDTHDRIHEVI